MDSFDSYLILLQFSMALSPTESFPLKCSHGMFYTCLLPSCVDIFKGCFTSQNERLSLMYSEPVCFFLMVEIVEVVCVWWWHSSGATEWVSDTKQTADTAYWCQHESLLRSQRHRRRRRTSLSRKTASFHISSLPYTKQRVWLLPVNRFDIEKWYCLVGICTFGFEKKKKKKQTRGYWKRKHQKYGLEESWVKELREEYCAEKKFTINIGHVSCCVVPLHLSIYDLKINLTLT